MSATVKLKSEIQLVVNLKHMTKDTPVMDAAQLAAEEIALLPVFERGHEAAIKVINNTDKYATIIRKHFPSPLPVSGEIPTPRTDSAVQYFPVLLDGEPQPFVDAVTSAKIERELYKWEHGLKIEYGDDFGEPALILVQTLKRQVATERAAKEEALAYVRSRTIAMREASARADAAEAKAGDVAKLIDHFIDRADCAAETLERLGVKYDPITGTRASVPAE